MAPDSSWSTERPPQANGFLKRKQISSQDEAARYAASLDALVPIAGGETVFLSVEPKKPSNSQLDDVPPDRLLRLIALRRQVGPGFRLVGGARVIQAVPLNDGDILGRRRPLYGNYLAVQGADDVTVAFPRSLCGR